MVTFDQNPINLFAIALAAYKNNDRDLLTKARDALASNHGIKLIFHRNALAQQHKGGSDE